MFEDFQRLRNSISQHQAHLVVKQAALRPDEVIEEDAEVSKSIKHLYEQVMKPMPQPNQPSRGEERKKADSGAFYKNRNSRHVKRFIETSDKLSSFRVSFLLLITDFVFSKCETGWMGRWPS